MFDLIVQVLLVCFIGWTIHRFLTKTDLDNVPGPERESFWKGKSSITLGPTAGILTCTAGNLGQLFSVSGWAFNAKIAEQFGRVVKVYGLFGWRLLNFRQLQGTIKKQLANGAQEACPTQSTFEYMLTLRQIDILHWMGRAALEMLGQSGLGYTFDPLVEGAKSHPFSEAAKAFTPAVAKFFILREYLLPTLVKIGPPQFRRWVVDHLPSKNLRVLRDIVDTWDRTTTEIFHNKKRALEEGDEALAKQVGQAKDLMSILMKANMEVSEEHRLSEEEVLAQASHFIMTFAFAATDTTSNALSRTLHVLSSNPEAQDRLRAEVIEARKAHNGNIPYDDLVSLPFMDAVCRETLRLYPPVPRVLRIPRQDIVLPLSTPIKGLDGREMESILVPKDTKVFISILNANRDPLTWGPDSLEWKPERWLSPLPEAVHEAHIPGIYSHLFVFRTLEAVEKVDIFPSSLTFLGGGRACIGFKFSQLEMKVVLSTLITEFRFLPSEKEIVWQTTGITTPIVKGHPTKPQLPLKIEVVNS
ncbi:hypothetical protein H0H92_015550 [Tricholoma furcatifolium]|nr:hypothetical protein H0H92_015550 [Tricholoma furcatifolium]